jgi:hypothetical protein
MKEVASRAPTGLAGFLLVFCFDFDDEGEILQDIG